MKDFFGLKALARRENRRNKVNKLAVLLLFIRACGSEEENERCPLDLTSQLDSSFPRGEY